MAGEITLGVRSFKRARIVYPGEHWSKSTHARRGPGMRLRAMPENQ